MTRWQTLKLSPFRKVARKRDLYRKLEHRNESFAHTALKLKNINGCFMIALAPKYLREHPLSLVFSQSSSHTKSDDTR